MMYTPKVEVEKRKDKDQLMQYALFLLGQRDYFSAKMYDKLRSYAQDNEDAQSVLDYLIELNYINDERTLENKVRFISEGGSKGPTRIRQELIEKGAPSAMVSEALSAIDSEVWRSNCFDLYRTRYKIDWDTYKERDKRLRYLVNRGFSYQDAKDAVSTSLDDYCDS